MKGGGEEIYGEPFNITPKLFLYKSYVLACISNHTIVM